MTIKRFNARRDANELGIVRALEKCGALVLRLECPDLLVLHAGNIYMLEVKVKKNAALTENELKLIRDGWPVQVVENELMARRAIDAY